MRSCPSHSALMQCLTLKQVLFCKHPVTTWRYLSDCPAACLPIITWGVRTCSFRMGQFRHPFHAKHRASQKVTSIFLGKQEGGAAAAHMWR